MKKSIQITRITIKFRKKDKDSRKSNTVGKKYVQFQKDSHPILLNIISSISNKDYSNSTTKFYLSEKKLNIRISLNHYFIFPTDNVPDVILSSTTP